MPSHSQDRQLHGKKSPFLTTVGSIKQTHQQIIMLLSEDACWENIGKMHVPMCRRNVCQITVLCFVWSHMLLMLATCNQVAQC